MTNAKVPTWFWVVAALALAWNLLGVMAYFAQVTITDEALAALPQAERALFEATPAWVTGAFALAVFGGALGCVALLLRKAWAAPLFTISLVGVLAQMAHNVLVAKSYEVYGPGPGLMMPMMVLIIAILLLWLALSGKKKGWLS